MHVVQQLNFFFFLFAFSCTPLPEKKKSQNLAFFWFLNYSEKKFEICTGSVQKSCYTFVCFHFTNSKCHHSFSFFKWTFSHPNLVKSTMALFRTLEMDFELPVISIYSTSSTLKIFWKYLVFD
jgi:hypothetical protein